MRTTKLSLRTPPEQLVQKLLLWETAQRWQLSTPLLYQLLRPLPRLNHQSRRLI